MKKKVNNNKTKISWIGKQYEPEIESPDKFYLTCFYRKCIMGPLTLEIGNYVLVSNMDSADPDSISGCDIARIDHMYELMTDDPEIDTFRAIVQWYSRPSAIPDKIIHNENYKLDFNHEIIEDYRFTADINIETIFGHCKVAVVDTDVNISELVAKNTSTLPLFIARFKLCHIPGVKKLQLLALKQSAPGTTPLKRKSILDKTNSRGQTTLLENQRAPKLKLTRSKSIEFVDCTDDSDIRQAQKVLNREEWKVKVIDDAYKSSYKKNLLKVTEGLGEVEISDEENISPSKIARMNNARRKSGNFRRNLNASLYCESATSDEDLANYSIIKDESKNTPDMKITLRLSERLQSEANSSSRRASRKRSTYEDNTPFQNEISPIKTRKSMIVDEEVLYTPTGRPRRKSILKTPSTKISESVGTPKRIQLSNIVEEFDDGRHVSRKIKLTPKKAELVIEEAKTPRSRSAKSVSQSTPSSATKMKLIRSGAIKPSLHKREAPIQTSIDTQFAMARERLHVSAVPSLLPCREKEYSEILNFVEGKIIDGCGGCMYISGVPGTGKTATTTAVIRSLQSLAEDEEIPKFEFVEINGMRLTEPRQSYVHIYRQLTGKTMAWEQAYNLLEKRFTTKAPRRITTVVLVDELDILCNKRQDVVYNLLNWPTISSAQLVVITIANTMDLPERLLMGKISSRLGLTRLTFQPYNFRQLQEIVMSRLTGTTTFDAEAVQFVARKVAAVSGDARRALDICRRATEIADEKSREDNRFVSVSMVHVQQALSEMIASAKVQTIKSCSRLEQLFLQAVTAEVARTGIEECSFLGVYSQFESLTAFAGIVVPNPGRAIAICSRLGASRILICESSRNDIYQKILLNISSDDVHYALQASSLI